MKHYKEGVSESEFSMNMVRECVISVNTPDERITEWSNKDMDDFIDSMTTSQFEKVGEFISSAPTLKKEVEYTCVKCGNDNKLTLEGLQDFF